jgi:VCBS repeat-containing protein
MPATAYAAGMTATNNGNPQTLVNQLLGSGVTASNVTSAGAGASRGTFAGGAAIVGIDSGVVLSSGNSAGLPGPNNTSSYSTSNNTPGDANLTVVAGATYDAAVLEFDFVPSKDTVNFSYVFGSDEYNEYANSSFNDAFGFFVNGVNCAKLPDNTTPVTINNVNLVHNPQYYVNNQPVTHDTQMDGYTVPLTCLATVQPNVTNHIKLAIADVGDTGYDSWVLLKAGSFSTEPPVNAAPVSHDDAYTTAEDTTLNQAAPGVLANDTDANSDPLHATLVSGPAHGALTLNTNGSFSYTPAANYNGADSFTYKANDGSADSGVATVNLTVTAVNDAPVATADSYSTNEDTVLTVAAPGVLGNDSDPDNDAITALIASQPAHGSVALNQDGSFSYTPNADYSGPDQFTYKATDGTANSNTVTVSLTVKPVNDAPTATGDSYTTNEDTALNTPAPGVLGNDGDIDGGPLTATLVSGTTHGSLSLNSNGSFDYTPAANYNGNDSFTYKANDGSADSDPATVTITVTPVNDSPVAVDDSYTTDEDTAKSGNVLGNDTDADHDPLTAALASAPSHGTLVLNPDGSFVYTPDGDFNGTDTFTYTASDGTDGSNVGTVTITVNPVNDAPVAHDDSYTSDEDAALIVPGPGTLGNDTDVEGDALTASVVDGPSHGLLTANPDGSFTYTPNANYNGADSFTYKANDGQADSNTATVSLTITPVNDAPVAANDAYSTAEDTTLVVPANGVLKNDSDVDGDALKAIKVTGPSHGTLALNADGSFSYSPAADYNGPDSFSYRASDGSLESDVATVDLTVTPVNDAPTATAGGPYTVAEGGSVTLDGSARDIDSDMSTLTYKWDFDADGEYDDAAGKTPTYSAATQDGPSNHPVALQVCDSDNACSSSASNVAVTNVAPTVAFTFTASGNEAGTFTGSGTVTDPGVADTFVASVTYGDGSPAQSVTVTNGRTFSLSHVYADDNPTGTSSDVYTVTVTVTDDDGGVGSASRNTTVNNVAPVTGTISHPAAPVALGGTVSVSMSFTDAGSLDTHTAVITWDDGTTTPGTVNASTRTVTGSHIYAEPGVYTISITVTDDDTGRGTSTMTDYVVVYDPNGGSVTGGGFITSPAGAYTADPKMTGRANFGFVSQFKKGATVPTGNTEFQFQAGNLNFSSTTYDWLVVAGSKAQYKGKGTINGAGSYNFLLTAVDSSPDRFRIKITGAGGTVYDNQMGSADDSSNSTELAGGSIVIHK